MKRVGSLICGLLLGAPLVATHAQGPVQQAQMRYLDAYYIADTKFEVGTTVDTDDGDGFGARLAMPLGDGGFFFGAEFQSADYRQGNNGNGQSRQTRVGLGYQTPWFFYGLAEWARHETKINIGGTNLVDSDEDGFGVHLGTRIDLFKYVTFDARVGYVDVDDTDGLEYVVGLGFNLDPHFGLFADYRVNDFDNDANGNKVDVKQKDVRAGLRFRF